MDECARDGSELNSFFRDRSVFSWAGEAEAAGFMQVGNLAHTDEKFAWKGCWLCFMMSG